MKKKLLTAVITTALSASLAFPSMAVNFTPMGDNVWTDGKYIYNNGSTEIKETTFRSWDGSMVTAKWASGKRYTFPGWVWIEGYCYYYTDYNYENCLKNCVTPDGYTVDELGRWTENGVPVSNGYGNMVVGTDQLYANKTDDERWQIMEDLCENLFANYLEGDEDSLAMHTYVDHDMIQGVRIPEGYANITLIKNPPVHMDDYVSLTVNNIWNDASANYSPYWGEVLEQTLRIVCGDQTGGELFADLKAAAEGTKCGPTTTIEYDENGNWIWIDENHVKIRNIDSWTDGIDFTKFDLKKWNGRKTDYGKTIEIMIGPDLAETNYEHTGEWELFIRDCDTYTEHNHWE